MMKKKYSISFVLVVVLLIQACSKLIYPIYPIPEYTGSLVWEKTKAEAEWTGRWDHAALSYQNKLWIMGGYSSGNNRGDSYLEDVWNSKEGENWHLLTDSAPWKGRRGHAAVVFDDGNGESMYILGGFSVDDETAYRQYNNDVWKSSDGILWEQIKTNTSPESNSQSDWSPRFNLRCEVLNREGKSYIYLIAGASIEQGKPAYLGMTYYNDVWRSDNGVNWEKLDSHDFGLRAEHSTTVNLSNGKIYMQGGTYGSWDANETHLDKPVYQWQELWSSEDGIHWESENDEEEFPQAYLYRAQHQIVHYEGYIWGFPGKNSSSVHYSKNPDTYAIWKLDSNGTWTVDSEGPPFMPMYGYALVRHDNKIFILGGHTTNRGPSNEVWFGKL